MFHHIVTITIVLLVGVNVVVALSPTPYQHTKVIRDVKDTVLWESHGRDDMREWRSTMLKGTTYLKVDFNFQDAATCAKQQRARLHPPSPNGCFLMEHNVYDSTPSYNTSWDVIDFLRDDKNLDVLNGTSHVVLQLCLKNKPDLCSGK
eukprot:PhM_4_TR14161/c1_g1_i12/m.99616